MRIYACRPGCLPLLFMAAFLLLAPAAARGEPPRSILRGVAPAHWRVVWTFDPAREATVSWDTADRGESHRVYFDTTPRGGDVAAYSHRLEAASNGRYTANEQAPYDLYYHHAELRDLTPDTVYYFVMASDAGVSPEFHFRTAPEADQPVQLIYGGDSRSDAEMRRAMNRQVARLVAEQPDVLALVHGGDYVVRGEELGLWIDWLQDHELTVTDDRRVLPIIPARGNHDTGPIYSELFNRPGGEEHYFATSLGPQCRLITLNTEISMAGDQAQWLREELAAAREAARWVCAQYHKPAWPAVKKPSGARQHWVPLFEEYNADLVMESDGHVIKRTPPIRDERYDPTGVTYIGEGGLGVPQRTPKTDRWYLKPPGFADRGHHLHLLTFTAESLRCQAIMLGGAIRDDWLLMPRQPDPVASPADQHSPARP